MKIKKKLFCSDRQKKTIFIAIIHAPSIRRIAYPARQETLFSKDSNGLGKKSFFTLPDRTAVSTVTLIVNCKLNVFPCQTGKQFY